MRVLLTGANGFVGSHILGELLEAGHEVVAAVRNPEALKRRFADVLAIDCDFNRDTSAEAWLSRLDGVDAVINCAGVLTSSPGQDIQAIHYQAPRALFDACQQAGVKRVIQISAVSADEGAGTAYASSKMQADVYLRSLPLDWLVLKPSLIYSHGSYGGTSVLRGLAALPGCVPVVDKGEQLFRPLHAKDLARGVVALLSADAPRRCTLEPAGPEVISMRDLLARLRSWMGLGPFRQWNVPHGLAEFGARIGDLLRIGAINTTALRQLRFGNTGDPAQWIQATGFSPRSLQSWQRREPSHVQDRWHARLFFLRPLCRVVLALLWLVSGILGLTFGRDAALGLMQQAGFSDAFAVLTLVATCVLDLLIGVLLLVWPRVRVLGLAQLLIVGSYTLILTVLHPGLWADPLGPLLKNAPILALVLVWMALEDDR